MALDILDLAAFYDTPLGAHVQRRLAAAVQRIWPQPPRRGERILGYGYATPLAAPLWPQAEWHLLMPAQQGVPARDPANDMNAPTALADETRWPVRDDSINRLLALHGLEAANGLDLVLDEAWRVLQPNGRALFVVPNRRGLWARRDKTPFGAGRPFSRRQMQQALRHTGFVPGLIRPALLLPPGLPVRVSAALGPAERAAAVLMPQIGGVWLVEAIKQVPAPLSVERARQARARRALAAPRPVFLPQGER